MFIGVGNRFPAALPHASPRFKILMATHWCCRVSPSSRVAGGKVSRINSCSLEIGGKSAGVSVRPKTKIEVRKEDLPPGRRSQMLKIST